MIVNFNYYFYKIIIQKMMNYSILIKTLCDTDSFLGCRATRKCRHCNGTGIVMDDNERIYLTKSSKCECNSYYYDDCLCPVKCECEGSGVCIECKDQDLDQDLDLVQDQEQDLDQGQDQEQDLVQDLGQVQGQVQVQEQVQVQVQVQGQGLFQNILLKMYIFILFNLYFYYT